MGGEVKRCLGNINTPKQMQQHVIAKKIMMTSSSRLFLGKKKGLASYADTAFVLLMRVMGSTSVQT